MLAGGVAINVGRAAAELLAALTLVRLSSKECALCVSLALALSCLMQAAFGILPDAAYAVAFAAFPIGYAVASYPIALKSFGVYAEGGFASSVRDLAITEPRAFLPLLHRFFLAMCVFRAAFGYSLTLGSTAGAPVQMFAAFIPLAIVFFQLVRTKESQPTDVPYRVSTLLVIAGVLLVGIIFAHHASLPNVLLAAGADCFRVLSFFALASVARRNPIGGIVTFSWAFALMNASTVLGTSLGSMTNILMESDRDLAMFVVAAATFLFVAFNFVVMRDFSFEVTMRSIREVSLDRIAVRESAPASGGEVATSTPDMASVCEGMAKAAGLTKREAEVFGYLANGRNVPFIQEKLTVSHNTVRTHVKHIYQKLDVHSQQELISLAEQRANEG